MTQHDLKLSQGITNMSVNYLVVSVYLELIFPFKIKTTKRHLVTEDLENIFGAYSVMWNTR